MAAALLAALAAGCGDDGPGRVRPVTLALDFDPNAVHAPIYAAVREGYDRDEGVRIRIRPPGSAPDSLKLLAAGKADLAVLDIHDLGQAPARPRGAARRRVGPALGPGGAARRDVARRRRLPQGAPGHDRLRGRAQPDRQEGGRGAGVLECRGRGAEAPRRGHTRVPRR